MALGLFETPSRLLASVFSNGASISSGQVAYGDSAGKLVSAGGLLFNGTAQLSVGDGTSGSTLVLNGASGNGRLIDWRTGGSVRWRATCTSTAESGSNAGSNWTLTAFDDSGVTIDTPISLNRVAGGTLTFARPVINSYTEATAATFAILNSATATITGGVTDGFSTSLSLAPVYSAATAQTVTRHNYFNLVQPGLTGAGPAALTDACVFRFNAAAGTHKAVDSGTTKTSPGTVTAWLKVNINGTIHYLPAYSSKTT